MDDSELAVLLAGITSVILALVLVIGLSAGIAYLLAYGIATVTAVEYSTGLFALCFAIVLLIGVMTGE